MTHPVIAPLVAELAGASCTVRSIIPNGMDPHDWSPSAKDTQALTHALLIVRIGLGMESGMERALGVAKDSGVGIFTLADHVSIRRVAAGEGKPGDDPDQATGAADPHIWTDPVTMKAAILALATYFGSELGTDVSKEAAVIAGKLDALDAEIRKMVDGIPREKRKLVTGHESLGYFAKSYGLTVIGAIIPSLSTQAEESASDMAAIKKLIVEHKVGVVFGELGTPPKVTEALARETGVKVVILATHLLPNDMSYYSFMKILASAITESLR